MLRTGLVIDARYQNHQPGRQHPERPARIGSLLRALESYRRPGLTSVSPRLASEAEIGLIHDTAHIGRVAATAGPPGTADADGHQTTERASSTVFAFDADTQASALSYETARLAAGGLLAILDAVMDGEVDNGFGLVRPPGHHAERNRAMGFCLFNSAAIGAQYLRERFGLSRVLLMDWDLHHGNGSQHSFSDDPGVLYASTHQYPYYPGTGAAQDVGQGAGAGYTVNLPIPAGWGDAEYQHLFETIIDPICRQFDPQFVLISAGFDAHVRDPLGGLRMTEAGFGGLARVLLRIARDHAQGRCAALLEGGYDLIGLEKSVLRVLDEMGGEQLATPLPEVDSRPLLPQVVAVQRTYWELANKS